MPGLNKNLDSVIVLHCIVYRAYLSLRCHAVNQNWSHPRVVVTEAEKISKFLGFNESLELRQDYRDVGGARQRINEQVTPTIMLMPMD